MPANVGDKVSVYISQPVPWDHRDQIYLGLFQVFRRHFFIFDPKRCILKGSPEDNRSAKLPYPDSGKKEGLETTMKQHWGGQVITTTTAPIKSQYMGTKSLSLISWIRCKSKSIRVPHILQRPRPGEIFFCNVFDHFKENMWDLKKRTNRIKSVVRVQRKDRKSNLGLMIRT